MKRLAISMIVGMIAFPFLCFAQQTNSLETVAQSFQKQELALLEGYSQALGTLMENLKQSGELDAYLVVEAERLRFSTNRVVLLPSEAKPAFSEPVGSYYKAVVALLKKQVLALDALVKSEMKADRIASAKESKAEKTKLEFLLADLESKLPKETVKAPAKGTSVVAVANAPNTIKHSVVGRWRDSAGVVMVFLPDGRSQIPSAPQFKETWKYTKADRTEIKRFGPNGKAVFTLEYDPIADTLVQDSRSYTRVSADK